MQAGDAHVQHPLGVYDAHRVCILRYKSSESRVIHYALVFAMIKRTAFPFSAPGTLGWRALQGQVCPILEEKHNKCVVHQLRQCS